jgi:hypothetical protein
MKTQRIFGILWLALFLLVIGIWLLKLVRGGDVSSDLAFHPLAGVVYLFGVIASAFVIQDARWARIAIAIMAMAIAVLAIYLMWQARHWHPVDTCVVIFALASAVVLLPRRAAA